MTLRFVKLKLVTFKKQIYYLTSWATPLLFIFLIKYVVVITVCTFKYILKMHLVKKKQKNNRLVSLMFFFLWF
jgi:hypothetical protein